MKKYLITISALITTHLFAQQRAPQLYNHDTACDASHAFIATLSLGFIDAYRTHYTIPGGFQKNNTSGFAAIYVKAEYVINNVSIAGTFAYDKFNYNFSQEYDGYNGKILRYQTDNFRMFSGGITGYYHLGHLIKVKGLDPFAGLGISLNNIRHGAYPEGDSMAVKIEHTLSLYIKAGARYYITHNFSLFGDVGYDNHTAFSIGVSCRFSKKINNNDADGDGIPDRIDSCILIPGIQRFYGCPDSDGDGVPDNKDSCALQAGLAKYHGCPDSDGDGIIDKNDSCPTQAGSIMMYGCPDSDGDGIADKDDSCPKQPGPKTFQGCPDSDGDGVSDKDDACPSAAGPASNNGCPVEAPAKNKAINLTTVTIQFEPGKNTLGRAACARLDSLIGAMTEDMLVSLTIDGYTDITGSKSLNKKLSVARAASVKTYLKKRGITPGRLIIHGYGSKAPVANNRTAGGRAKNRRVVIKRRYEDVK